MPNTTQGPSMRSTVNHLLQLQEIILVRDEQRAIRGNAADLTAINESIDTLTESLDPQTKMLFQRLYRKDHIVTAPVSDSSCSMCKMGVAISQVQAVKLCRALVCCPSCARILYVSDGPKWIAGRRARAGEPPKTGIARFSSPDLMLPDLSGTTPEEVIAEFAGALNNAGFIDDPAGLARQAVSRESILGTGVGNGLAFPHVRGVEGGGLSLAFGISRKGVKFDGAEDGPAHFIFFSTIPSAVSAFYLRLLAALTESFTKDANRSAALESAAPKDLWKNLVKATRSSVK
jgi:Phosphotransferase system mannitol/fructose-specific IIA domain (Ntr-type)